MNHKTLTTAADGSTGERAGLLTDRGSGNVVTSSSAYKQSPSWRYLALVFKVASCFEIAVTTCTSSTLRGLRYFESLEVCAQRRGPKSCLCNQRFSLSAHVMQALNTVQCSTQMTGHLGTCATRASRNRQTLIASKPPPAGTVIEPLHSAAAMHRCFMTYSRERTHVPASWFYSALHAPHSDTRKGAECHRLARACMAGLTSQAFKHGIMTGWNKTQMSLTLGLQCPTCATLLTQSR